MCYHSGMKKILVLTLALTLTLAFANASDWLPGFDDVPQMERTFVVADGGFVFSQAEGQIIQATIYTSEVSRRRFQGFYSDAMRELGWRRVRNTTSIQKFTRGDEQLTIEIIASDPLTARFTLTPR